MFVSSNRNADIAPEDILLYSLALRNRFGIRDLAHQAAFEIPVFVYCPLVYPWVMSMVLQAASPEDVARRMTRATLRGHFRLTVKHIRRPTILRSPATPSAAVDGVVVLGVNESCLQRIAEYIGSDHKKGVVEAEIILSTGESRAVAAYTFVWNDSMSALEAKKWTPMDYMRGHL